MAAKVEYKASVQKDLQRLDRHIALQILRKIERVLVIEQVPGDALTGDFMGLYCLRVGDYRVIYCPTGTGYLVLRIAHRREVYRRGRPEIQ